MQRQTAFLWIFILPMHSAYSQPSGSFAGFLRRVNVEDPSKRTTVVDSFMTAQSTRGFPATEDSIAYFVYRGNVSSSIAVTGDQTRWSGTGEPMMNVSATNFYYAGRKFEADGRFDYKFIKDGALILDPLNPRTVSGGFGPNSELAMPAYVQPAEIRYDTAIAHGTINAFFFKSAFIDDTLTVKVYLPPLYEASSSRFPSIYVHDGLDYLSLASMANVLDNLIAAKKIEPLIGIFVPPGFDRSGKYRLGKRIQFTSVIVNELVPYIDSLYRTDAHASRRGTMGSSDGGHIALLLAVSYPGTFGLVGGQSSTITDMIRTPIQTGPKLPVRFYLDVGTYDISDSTYDFLDLNRGFRDMLVSKGYDVTYAEYHEGHSWGNWRAHVDDILKTLFPYAPTKQRK